MIKGGNLYVSGLPKHWTQTDLDCLFAPFGNIVTSRILCDLQTGNLWFIQFFVTFHFFILYSFMSEKRTLCKSNGYCLVIVYLK